MDRIEKLREQYYESIRLLQKEQDILNALPQPEYENFFPLISGIIKMLETELKENQQELANELDPEMKEYMQDEIKLIQFKINVCSNLWQKGLEDEKIEEEALSTPKKNIIFATTDSGNICIENDLKDIPEEYLQSVEDSLRQLQEGFTEENIEKGKSMSNNAKLSKVHELKPFKIRIFYKILSQDTVYVLMIKMKKSNNALRDRREIEERVEQSTKQYERLKKEIKDPKKKEELIGQNKELLDRILGHIEHKKRWHKWVKEKKYKET